MDKLLEVLAKACSDGNNDTTATLLNGSRIINLEKLKEYISALTVHAAQCRSEIVLIGEQKAGLASVLSSKCAKYHFSLKLDTSSKVKGPKNYSRWECNLSSVWAQMCTGGGHSKLKETMSIIGIPVMSSKNFVRTERAIGEFWKRELQHRTKS